MFGILLHIFVKMENIMDYSAIMCDEIINVKETNFNEKNSCKTQEFCILLAF